MTPDLEKELRETVARYLDRAREAEARERHLRRVLDQIAAGAPMFDLVAHIERAITFSQNTFGPGARSKGIVAHMRKELGEIEADPLDVTEWIDVMILAIDGAWRALDAKATLEGDLPPPPRRLAWEIVETLDGKQARNKARTWPDWRTASPDQPIEHDRTGETQGGAR